MKRITLLVLSLALVFTLSACGRDNNGGSGTNSGTNNSVTDNGGANNSTNSGTSNGTNNGTGNGANNGTTETPGDMIEDDLDNMLDDGKVDDHDGNLNTARSAFLLFYAFAPRRAARICSLLWPPTIRLTSLPPAITTRVGTLMMRNCCTKPGAVSISTLQTLKLPSLCSPSS